jgi:hypothetical protein
MKSNGHSPLGYCDYFLLNRGDRGPTAGADRLESASRTSSCIFMSARRSFNRDFPTGPIVLHDRQEALIILGKLPLPFLL